MSSIVFRRRTFRPRRERAAGAGEDVGVEGADEVGEGAVGVRGVTEAVLSSSSTAPLQMPCTLCDSSRKSLPPPTEPCPNAGRMKATSILFRSRAFTRNGLVQRPQGEMPHLQHNDGGGPDRSAHEADTDEV